MLSTKNNWFFLFLIAWALVVLDVLYTGRMNGTCVLILCTAAGTAFWLWHRPQQMEKYFRFPLQVAVALISIYFTFALEGDRLFITGKRMNFNGRTLLLFALYTVILYPIVYTVLWSFECVIEYLKKKESKRDKNKVIQVGLLLFLTFAVIELIFSLGFFPANMSNDSMSHWLQATGYYNLNNSSPIFYTLLIRGLSKIAMTPYVVVVFQILFYAAIICKWLLFLYKKGVPFKFLVLFDVIFAILPSNYITLTYISKNPIFAIFNLWVLMQFVYLIDDPQRCAEGIRWNIETTIALSSLYLVRLNTFFAVWSAAIIIVLMTFFHYRIVQWKLLPSLLGTFAIVILFQGPLCDFLDVDSSNYGNISGSKPPLTMVYSSLLINEVEIPKDIQEIMENVLPKEEYISRHKPYNSDVMGWTNPRPNYGDMTTREGMAIYLRLLALYPDIVIQERLQGTDSLWNIQNRGHYPTSRYEIGLSEHVAKVKLPNLSEEDREDILNKYGLKIFKSNKITDYLLRFSRFIERHPLPNAFVWRNGIYIVLMFIFVLLLTVHRHINFLIVCIPSVVTLITLFLVIGWQLYSYYSFFPVAIMAFITCGCAIIAKKD